VVELMTQESHDPTGPAWLASGGQPGIGGRAETAYQQTGYTGKATSPEEYLFESIVNPGAYLVANYSDGLMPAAYGGSLSEQDLADLIAYLLTLK
jgi:hypothetical protein